MITKIITIINTITTIISTITTIITIIIVIIVVHNYHTNPYHNYLLHITIIHPRAAIIRSNPNIHR